MKIGIIGLGLMGGSLAKAITGYTDHSCAGYDIQKEVLSAALEDGCIQEQLSLDELERLDLTLVCLSPSETINFVLQHKTSFRPGSIVLDICGVKAPHVSMLTELLAEHRVFFVGTHPMAGREQSGFAAALAELFQGASFIITPTAHTPQRIVDFVSSFALSLGFGEVILASPEEHDQRVAYTSQLAHLVSSAYVKSPTLANEHGFSAGSFHDMTRVAQLNPTMWSQLFLLNRVALLRELEELQNHLSEYHTALTNDDEAALIQLLADGSAKKIASLNK
ncbi:MAG: prephenate dehydrogenase [Clostridia bacterium]